VTAASTAGRERDGGRAARRGLLSRNSDFARLWFGESVSAVGSQITLLALPLLAVSDLGASAGQMGLLGAAETTPFLLFALLAGVWVDRRRKRPILVVANAARAALLALGFFVQGLGSTATNVHTSARSLREPGHPG
jgi:MFS family permease